MSGEISSRTMSRSARVYLESHCVFESFGIDSDGGSFVVTLTKIIQWTVSGDVKAWWFLNVVS